MAQIKLAEYTFDNSIGDCLPTITGATTSQWEYTDIVDGNITTRTIGTDEDSLPITQYSFSGKSSLLTVDYLRIDSNITSMYDMFLKCSNLVSVNSDGWDTSNVTNMSGVFYSCSSLTSLDLSGWDTSKVTNMEGMFAYDGNIMSIIGLNRIDTSNVTDMNHMFFECSSLTSLDVSNWDTSKVTDVSGMFNYCSSLTSLDVSNWDTSNITTMRSLFNRCSSLTSLDLSGWDTSKVTNMRGMFINITLTSLDLSNFDTSNVTTMRTMFQDCSSLTSLDLSNFDTSNVTDFTNIFRNTSRLTNIGLLYASVSTINSLSSNMTSVARTIWYQDADATELNSVTNIETKLYKSNILTVDGEYGSVGGIEDIVDLTTGKATIKTRQTTVTSENVKYNWSNDTHTCFYISQNDMIKGYGETVKSNLFPSGSINEVGSKELVTSDGAKNIIFSILNARLSSTDLTGVIKFLEANELNVRYLLATESIKTVVLSDNVVYSYDEVTHYDCSSEEGSLIPTLSVKVPTDTQLTIQEQKATTQTLLIKNMDLQQSIKEVQAMNLAFNTALYNSFSSIREEVEDIKKHVSTNENLEGSFRLWGLK